MEFCSYYFGRPLTFLILLLFKNRNHAQLKQFYYLQFWKHISVLFEGKKYILTYFAWLLNALNSDTKSIFYSGRLGSSSVLLGRWRKGIGVGGVRIGAAMQELWSWTGTSTLPCVVLCWEEWVFIHWSRSVVSGYKLSLGHRVWHRARQLSQVKGHFWRWVTTESKYSS